MTERKFDALPFANHRVTQHYAGHYGDEKFPYEMLTWQKPGSWINGIRYFRLSNRLVVTGDWYEAVYMVYENQSLTWWAETAQGYFASKCVASDKGRNPKDWSHALLTQRVLEYWEIHQNATPEMSGNIKQWLSENSTSNARDWEEMLRGHCELGRDPADLDYSWAEHLFGSDMCDVPDGLCTAYPTVVHHGALRLAIDWLKRNQPKR